MRKIFALLSILGFVALACGGPATATPSPSVDDIVGETMAAYTLEAALTQAALPSETPLPPSPASPEAPPPVTATPQEMAPDPLPAMNTGIILNNGECFNFDTGQVVASPDAQCDVWLVQSALFRQANGARISGYVTMTAPTRSACLSARFEPGDLAVQTDLYYCFISNEGNVGFIIARDYWGGIPATGIIFDYWVFR